MIKQKTLFNLNDYAVHFGLNLFFSTAEIS
jgi:hypothetical protein